MFWLATQAGLFSLVIRVSSISNPSRRWASEFTSLRSACWSHTSKNTLFQAHSFEDRDNMKRCRRNIPLEICFVETLVVSGFNYFRRRSFIQYMYEGNKTFLAFLLRARGINNQWRIQRRSQIEKLVVVSVRSNLPLKSSTVLSGPPQSKIPGNASCLYPRRRYSIRRQRRKRKAKLHTMAIPQTR